MYTKEWKKAQAPVIIAMLNSLKPHIRSVDFTVQYHRRYFCSSKNPGEVAFVAELMNPDERTLVIGAPLDIEAPYCTTIAYLEDGYLVRNMSCGTSEAEIRRTLMKYFPECLE